MRTWAGIRRAVREGYAQGNQQWPNPALIEGSPVWWLKAYRHGFELGYRTWTKEHR